MAVNKSFTSNSSADAESGLSPIDIVACNSVLGNLFRFVCGDGDMNIRSLFPFNRFSHVQRNTMGLDRFRILVEVVRHSVFFIRRENDARDTIPCIIGYGHTFLEACTRWSSQVRGSVTHQRILCYKFAGLKCLVRHKCDGYIPNTTSGSSTPSEERFSNNDDLADALAGISIDSPRASTSNIKIYQAGSPTPQALVFDIKTRSARYRNIYTSPESIIAQEVHRLWLAQLPTLVLAYHQNGVFSPNEIHIKDVRTEVREWERKMAAPMVFESSCSDLLSLSSSSSFILFEDSGEDVTSTRSGENERKKKDKRTQQTRRPSSLCCPFTKNHSAGPRYPRRKI